MVDITISYKDNTIAEINESGSKKLLTKGKYCEDDISIDYVKSGGGSEEGYQQGYNDGYSKGSMPIYYLQKYDFAWYNVTFPENTDLVIRVQKPPKSHNAMFSGTRNIKTLKMICEDKSGTVTLDQFVRASEHLEVLDLTEYNRNIESLFMFVYCADNLKTILGALDLTNCTNTTNAFQMSYNKDSLEDIEFVPNTIKTSISFSSLRFLTDKSIQSIIDGLADLTGQTAQTLTLHATVGAKLTDTQKAIITAKNWILAY